MNIPRLRTLTSIGFSLALLVFTVAATTIRANAQCDTVITGLREPLDTTLTNVGNLLVSETGTPSPGSGRISIIDSSGSRRTLLAGLPSAINDVSEPSGPAGLFMRGRTLYVAMGVGDVGRAGPIPGTTIPNVAGPSSPLFSSILAIQFSANTEKTTDGFTLSPTDEQTLASGQTLTLSDSAGNRMMIKLIADFQNYVSFPLPFFGGNVQLSNPFGLAAIEDELYVTDGGRNRVWQVDLVTGTVSTLVTFPPIPNPLFGIVPAGGPMLDAVPTGIAVNGDQLLVTLFRGAPFPPGTSTVESIDPATGTDTPFITGLKSAIDILPVAETDGTHYLVLQHASAGPFFGSPGQVKRFDTPAGPATILAACLTRPTSMSLDRKSNILYVSEYGGRIVAIAL
jgi:hypothetical protein